MKTVHIGDKGDTNLVGKKTSKDDPRVEAYGTADELNSVVGLAESLTKDSQIKKILEKVQESIFVVGAELATVTEKGSESRIKPEDVKWIETEMESLEKELKPINRFVLPGGTTAAAALHAARTVCRRCERRIVTLSKNESVNPEVIRYVNRLSDLLFVLARIENQRSGTNERGWGPKGMLSI